jgi:hypothetical protein
MCRNYLSYSVSISQCIEFFQVIGVEGNRLGDIVFGRSIRLYSFVRDYS